MRQQHSEVGVALFADAAQASGGAGRTFPGGEAQVAGEMPTGAKGMNVSDESDESGGGQDTDTGDGEQSLDGRKLSSKGS